MKMKKRIKTRYHKILFDNDTPFRSKVIPNKKKRNTRKQKQKLINSSIEEKI